MSTARESWKRRERQAAAIFGALRQPLSGSCGRASITTSDTDHPSLYIECKMREKHSVRSLFDKVKEKARKERKLPLLALYDKGKRGCLIVVHVADLDALVEELGKGGTDEATAGVRALAELDRVAQGAPAVGRAALGRDLAGRGGPS